MREGLSSLDSRPLLLFTRFPAFRFPLALRVGTLKNGEEGEAGI